MICKKCGCHVSDTATFCDKCGAPMAEFGQKEVCDAQKSTLSKEKRKKIILVVLIVVCVFILLYGAKKVACARAAVKEIRNDYYVTEAVEKVYIRHSSFRTEAVYVIFENEDDYICYVFAGEAGKADTRKNYGYSDTWEQRAEEFEEMADWIKRGSLPILPILVDAS